MRRKAKTESFSLMLTTEQIKETVAAYFKDKPVQKVYLFGSYARGEADEQSDVDLLVDLDRADKIGWDYFIWPEELAQELGKKVDVVSSDSLNPNRFFTKFVLDQRKLLYAKPA